MDVEQNQPNLPYQPLAFVHTATIGTNLQNKGQVSVYNWKYSDVVKPVLTFPYLYYLFHVPPVYNWIKQTLCFQRQSLRKYLKMQKQNILSFTQFKETLLKYSEKWQIMKLCLKSQVKVLTTYKQCSHLPQTQQWSPNYHYSHSNKCIYAQQIYCKHCQRNIKGSLQIVKFPYAPMFSKFHGDTLINNLQKNEKEQASKYYLTIVYEEKFIYIRAANSIWYEISLTNGKVMMKNYVGKKNRQGTFVYIHENASKDIGLLKQAKLLEEKPQEIKKQPKKIKEEKSIKLVENYEETVNLKKEKFKRENQGKKKKKSKLKSLEKEHNLIILPQSEKGEAFQSYKMEVEKLYDKPKQKDEYEKQYDKGKTKKIRKKIDYLKPNYNQVYRQVKRVQEKVQRNEGNRYSYNDNHRWKKGKVCRKQKRERLEKGEGRFKKRFRQREELQ